MKSDEKQIQKAIQDLGSKINDETKAEIFGAVNEMMQTGAIPKDKLGFPEEKIEALYGQAYRLYNTGKYQDAIHIFRMLILLNPPQGKYMLGLAACFHMLKDWENAVKVYMICSMVDSENPIPLFHSSDCYIQMRDRASAIISLEMAVQRAKDKPEYQILKDRALLTIASLKKELAQMAGGGNKK